MKTHHKAFGIAVVTLIAALLGFVTPDATGGQNTLLPSILMGIGFIAMAAGIAGQYGSPRMRAWVTENF